MFDLRAELNAVTAAYRAAHGLPVRKLYQVKFHYAGGKSDWLEVCADDGREWCKRAADGICKAGNRKHIEAISVIYPRNELYTLVIGR